MTRTIPFAAILLCLPVLAAADLPTGLALYDVPACRSAAGTSLYAEILCRDPQPYTTGTRPTNAHESCHGINARLRTAANQRYGRGNGFYVLGGQGVIVPEPQMRKGSVAPYVPASLRGSRFQTYLLGSPDWEDRPTYVLDEWSAYVAGGAVAVEDHRAGRPVERADWLCGPVEFSFYAVALAMAVEKNDAAYWRDRPELKAFIRHELALARRVYDEGRGIREYAFGDQDKLIAAFRTSPDAAALRAFVVKHFDSAWLGE